MAVTPAQSNVWLQICIEDVKMYKLKVNRVEEVIFKQHLTILLLPVKFIVNFHNKHTIDYSWPGTSFTFYLHGEN